MKLKKKICAGFDGVEHEDYIYKNIGGKKYCKSCTMKLEPPKPFKIKIKPNKGYEQFEEDVEFYKKVWDIHKGSEGKAFCESCEKQLPSEPNLTYFHHILEKRKYPQYRHFATNIMILCSDCHSTYETMPDLKPDIVKRKKEMLEAIDHMKNIIREITKT